MAMIMDVVLMDAAVVDVLKKEACWRWPSVQAKVKDVNTYQKILFFILYL
jgi:hypothetical protein